MLVKICGIKTREAARTAVEHGADFVGFVFAGSKRKVTPAEAAELARELPSSVKKVGVFVNEEIETIREIAAFVGLDVIQLHGDEPEELARNLDYEIIKAFPAEEERLIDIADYPCDYFLIDTPSKTSRGGSGRTFDWNMLDTLSIDFNKVLLAGGLDAGNVQQAIQTVKPGGVDVSSGVETDGEKDPVKIKQFLNQVRQSKEESIE